MTFDYYTLKKHSKSGDRLGSWNGKPVFTCSVRDLDNKSTGAYFILYDDENKIVCYTNGMWKSYGIVTENGSVNEYSGGCRTYTTPAEAEKRAKKAVVGTGGSYSPGYDMSERPTGDVKLELDVEKVLKTAREMTVESLLDGFLPGVVAKG